MEQSHRGKIIHSVTIQAMGIRHMYPYTTSTTHQKYVYGDLPGTTITRVLRLAIA